MFDIIVRLIMSLALIWMGINLFLGPRSYKVELRGEVPIDPKTTDSDFFRTVVEQKSFYKKQDEGLSHF